jgi:putative FmdB family regulatory protein
MPTYSYHCDACGHDFDAVQRFADEALTDCPQCGSSIRRVIQPVGVVFKGSGWYITDSRPKSTSESAETSTKPTTTSDKGDKVEKVETPAKTEKTPAKVAD